VLDHDATVSASLDRYRIAPPGIFGGGEGARSGLYVDVGDGEGAPGAQGRRMAVPPGTLISHRTGGGGGYGDPAKRDPEAVRADVTRGT